MPDQKKTMDKLMENLVDDILYLDKNEGSLQRHTQLDISKRILTNAKKFKKLCQK